MKRFCGVDFLSLSAHKCHGPTGFGLLYVRYPDALRPLLVGGGQQWGRRPGTESVGGALAVAASLEDANDPSKLAHRLDRYSRWTNAVWGRTVVHYHGPRGVGTALAPFVLAGWVLRTGPLPGPERAAHHVSFCVRGVPRQWLVRTLDEEAGVLVSGGSACTSESALPSHVLAALEVPPEFIQGSVRITFSHTNTDAEVHCQIVPALVRLLNYVTGHRR